MRNRISKDDYVPNGQVPAPVVLPPDDIALDLSEHIMREEDSQLLFGGNAEADMVGWSHWFAWLCDNLRSDVMTIAEETIVSSRHLIGQCGFFNSPHSPVLNRRGSDEYTTVMMQTDSDDESVANGTMLMQGRY